MTSEYQVVLWSGNVWDREETITKLINKGWKLAGLGITVEKKKMYYAQSLYRTKSWWRS